MNTATDPVLGAGGPIPIQHFLEINFPFLLLLVIFATLSVVAEMLFRADRRRASARTADLPQPTNDGEASR
jgi:hypothetical protein